VSVTTNVFFFPLQKKSRLSHPKMVFSYTLAFWKKGPEKRRALFHRSLFIPNVPLFPPQPSVTNHDRRFFNSPLESQSVYVKLPRTSPLLPVSFPPRHKRFSVEEKSLAFLLLGREIVSFLSICELLSPFPRNRSEFGWVFTRGRYSFQRLFTRSPKMVDFLEME